MIVATIAICTWNRAPLLARTLASLGRLLPPPVGVEILVVDNGSTDDTAAVVNAANMLPIRRVVEPVQGLSVARNRAIAEASGELILWLDDDVEVAQDWLGAYLEAAAAEPAAAFFGGPIRLRFLASPPSWLVRNVDVLGSAFAARDLGDVPLVIRNLAQVPFGANMAIRRTALCEIGFDCCLGRCGTNLLSGEETWLFARLLDRGAYGVWVPAAAVDHLISAERLTLDYVRRYFQGLARSELRRGRFSHAGLGATPDRIHRKLRRLCRQSWLTPWRGQRWAKLWRRRAELEGVLDELARS